MSKQKYPQTQSVTGKATVGRRLKTEGYCSATLHAKRDQRRREADARDVVYAALSLHKKLALLEVQPGKSARQRARLQKAAMAESQVFAG